MRLMFGPALYEAFREIKRTFDPNGIFNPGKIVDAPPLTSNLRFGAAYKTSNPPTWFDFDEYGGMSFDHVQDTEEVNPPENRFSKRDCME